MSKKKDPRNAPKGAKAERLTRADVDLWRAVTRDVRTFSEDPYADIEGLLDDNPEKKVRERIEISKKIEIPVGRSFEVDRKTLERLRRGKVPIEAKLDLHGMGQDQAYAALVRFIEGAAARGQRCVLVVTGKGRGGRLTSDEDWLAPKAGVLKSKVPEWLMGGDFKGLVLRAMEAQPKDGGSGALYIYLRRQRREEN